ncbi:MAG: 30S ribosomal protein S4, partial [Nanoarchaeota archaeon]|nr:30S ribosomal protein S4 [Nanoarchaeota archaeon]
MGDPRKKRKKYSTPAHPWQKDRIDTERVLLQEYGLKNKKEIWKMGSFLKGLFAQTKKVIREETKQSAIEKEQLLNKVYSLGLLQKGAKVEDVLSLTIKDILGRRLQTLAFRKNLTRSIKQARQFITHKHIFIGDRSITVPSYLVTLEEEALITFRPTSKLSSIDHPERVPLEVKKEEPKKEEAKKEEPKKEDAKKDEKKTAKKAPKKEAESKQKAAKPKKDPKKEETKEVKKEEPKKEEAKKEEAKKEEAKKEEPKKEEPKKEEPKKEEAKKEG